MMDVSTGYVGTKFEFNGHITVQFRSVHIFLVVTLSSSVSKWILANVGASKFWKSIVDTLLR